MQGDIKATRRSRRLSGPALLRLMSVYIAALLLVVLAGVMTMAAWRMYGLMARANNEAATAKSQLIQIEHQQAVVSQNLERLSTPQGREAELRARYGVARPGEGVIHIVEGERDSAKAGNPPQGFFERIWHAVVVW